MEKANYNLDNARAIISRRLKVDRVVAKCEHSRDLYDQLFERYEMTLTCETKVSLVLASISNCDSLMPQEQLEKLMTSLCERLMNLTRSADVIVDIGLNGFAVLLVDCDQYSAAKVCQRFKEAIHKVFYLNPTYAKDLEFDFGIGDDPRLGSSGLEKLIDDAQAALRYANQLGNGAIVRISDMSPTACDQVRPEHFVVGETRQINH